MTYGEFKELNLPDFMPMENALSQALFNKQIDVIEVLTSYTRALEAYPVLEVCNHANGPYDTFSKLDVNKERRDCYQQGYEQAEKDIKEAIVKHFKYKQDHSPEHTLHWWVYKNVIDKVNEL